MTDLKNLLYQDIKQPSLFNWDKTKRRWAKKLNRIPKNSEILTAFRDLVKTNQLQPNLKLEQSLRIRKVRTLSGVAPFAIMMKPFYCPGQCVYCPLEPGMPKSYLSNEPAAARAKKLNFDPKKQFAARIDQLKRTGHQPEKLQIIVTGGTFSAYPDIYKRQFLKAIFDAANGKTSKTIEKAQKTNETAKLRIIGMSIETRPDWITDDEVKLLRKYGVTKVQLGVQTLDEKVNQLTKRGHNTKAVVQATKKLRDAGFKINYHLMPNLPGSTPRQDVAQAQKLFSNSRFRPDTLKIYPCVVVSHSQLYDWWQEGQFKPYPDQTLLNILVKIKQLIPRYCRLDRVVRDISREWIAAGTTRTNMRQMAKKQLNKLGKTCHCIRCREIKGQPLQINRLHLNTISYQANQGQEKFIEFVDDKDRLYGLVRLRFPDKKAQKQPLFPALKEAALIRELQVFGEQIPLTTPNRQAAQHQSLGKKLMQAAENQAQKAGFKRIVVISGVGVRGYYRKLGYRLQDTYMVKSLSVC